VEITYPHMLRHYAYFQVLASLEEKTPAWNAALAGLSVLSLVEDARRDYSIIDRDWTGVKAVADGVEAIKEGSPLRRPLLKVVDELKGAANWNVVNQILFSYGRALDYDGHWNLAVDVFSTVADIALEDRVPELAIEATTALGGAARRSGDWDRSAEGYAEAAHLAHAVGDKQAGLTVRVGRANTQMAIGNIPAARTIFDEVIAEAEASGLDGVAARALHGRASVAFLQGQVDDTVSLAYRALEKTTDPRAKDGITADIAAAFQQLGMNEAARDAHIVISLTSRYQWVRWQAAINLMELAFNEGDEKTFEEYGRELKYSALDPRLRSYFLLYYGIGCLKFGRDDEGIKWIADARDFAAKHKINQVMFEAEAALAKGEKEIRKAAAAKHWAEPVSPEVLHVAEAFAELRKTAVSSPPAEDFV